MTYIINLFKFVTDEWMSIVFVILLLIVGIKKVISFLKMDKQKKLEIILKLVKEEILSLMAEAEVNWKDYSKSGEIKKSEVISKIYERFPILSKYINQEELIEEISKMIDEEKSKMDKIINNIETEEN